MYKFKGPFDFSFKEGTALIKNGLEGTLKLLRRYLPV